MLATLLTLALVIETRLPLPGGGAQTFRATVREAAQPLFTETPKPVSFKLESEVPASRWRIDASTDLRNWLPVGESTNETVIILECQPAKQQFWRMVPTVGPTQ